MGTIYRPPKEVGECPKTMDFFTDKKFDRDSLYKAEGKWIDKLREWCKQNSDDVLAGEVIKEPVADGYAVYMILSTKPVRLIHLPLGDAWESRWAHRWTAGDVKMMLAQERRLQEVLSTNKENS
jgi:hypothetical protein